MLRCRACDEEVQLSAAVHLYSPRLSVFVKQMELITNLVLPNLPELPTHICNNCKQKLSEAFYFRALCIRTQEKYDQLPTAKLPAADSLDPLSIIECEKSVPDVKVEIKVEGETSRNSCEDNDFSEISFDDDNDNENMEYMDDDCEDSENEIKDCENLEWQQHLQVILDKAASDGSIDQHDSEGTKSEEIQKKNKKCRPSEELTVCDQCGKSLQRKNLELHLLRHTGVKNFQCTLCKSKFYSDYLLELHTRKRHKSKEELEAENATRQLYKALTKESSLRTKRQMSTNAEADMSECNEQSDTQIAHDKKAKRMKKLRLICEQCEKPFKTRRDLQLHMLRHSGIKNFECEHCQARFYTLHLLKMHARKHTEPFKCRYCDETFGYNNSRNRHERLHTNERPFECKYCDKRFVCATSLKDHQVKHTGERNYHCTICDLRFSMNKQLHSHTRSKAHKEALLKLKKNLDEGNETGEV